MFSPQPYYRAKGPTSSGLLGYKKNKLKAQIRLAHQLLRSIKVTF